MDPTCILMCTNIPRGVSEDDLIELFCVAGPIAEVSLSKSGRSVFIIYEFSEAVSTAKEIFKDVKIYGRSLEMLDQNDIKQIHEGQEKESLALELQQAAYVEAGNQYPFHNADAMTPTYRNARNRPGPGNCAPPNCFMPPMNFPFPPNHFTPQINFTPPPNNFNGPQNPSFGDNYDPSVSNRRWGSVPEINLSQPFNPSELDSFKSPYSQPVSRKGYEQSRRNYCNEDASNSEHSKNRSFNTSTRNSDEFSSPDPSKFNNDNHGRNRNNHFKDTTDEYAYEKQSRRQFHTPKKSYRENDRCNRDSKYYSASTSSDHSNRYKSRDHDRSPYSRNNQQRFEQRDYRSNNYHGKESRNYRR